MTPYTLSDPLLLEIECCGASVEFDAFAVYRRTIAPALDSRKPGSIDWYQPIREWMAKEMQVEADLIGGNQVEEFAAFVHREVEAALADCKKKRESIASSPRPTPESHETSQAGPTN